MYIAEIATYSHKLELAMIAQNKDCLAASPAARWSHVIKVFHWDVSRSDVCHFQFMLLKGKRNTLWMVETTRKKESGHLVTLNRRSKHT